MYVKDSFCSRDFLHRDRGQPDGESPPVATAKRRNWDAALSKGVFAMGRRGLILLTFLFGLFGGGKPAVDRLQVLHGSRAAQVEGILPCAR